jgi:hypothetical protein
MNPIRATVDALAAEWAKHCQQTWFSSNLSHYLDHRAYRELSALGPEALPFIMEHYRADDLPWEFVLQEITGLRFIEDPNAYNPTEVKSRWLEWWAQQGQDAEALSRGTRPASRSE